MTKLDIFEVKQEHIDAIRLGDLVRVNNWKAYIPVVGISENYILLGNAKSNDYSVIPKHVSDFNRNNIVKGMFYCAVDFWIFGWIKGYHFDDSTWITEYLQSIESGETELTVRNADAISRLRVKRETKTINNAPEGNADA